MAPWVKPPNSIDPRTIVVPAPLASESTSSRVPVPEAVSSLPSEQPPSFSPADEIRRLKASHPLLKFSLIEKADELEAEAADTKPLLGQFVMDGQATMIYAPPNTGKTLIMLALILNAAEEGLIDPKNVFYFNADDGSRGLAVKNRLMADAGAHMVAPGRRGLQIKHLVETMTQAADDGSARGTLLIIDTLKKFADPMSKRESREFAQVCRQYVMAGGTIVALGHTRKNPKADGTYEYQGTTDIKEDFDAVYIAFAVKTKSPGQRVAKFVSEKKRADAPEVVAYAYADEAGLSYEEKLASVRAVDPDELEDVSSGPELYCEPLLMSAIGELIQAGQGHGQMALAKAAAKTCGVSHRAALGILQRYTGTTPREHLWTYQKGNRGVRVYELIPQD